MTPETPPSAPDRQPPRRRTAPVLAAAALAVALAAPATRAEELGDPDRGAALWSQCAVCHEIGEGAEHRVGPHLNDIFGRRLGGRADFPRYSPGLVRAGNDGLTWTAERLDAYLANPRALVTGTRMAFAGIDAPEDRADVVAFLRAYSASPADIPEAAPTARPADPDLALDPAILAIRGDPAYGAYLSGECTTCHRRDGASAGIPSITGWPEEDFVVAMHAYKNNLRLNPAMNMMASRLSDDEIAALAAYFGALQ
jgi:cytochrome c